MFVLAESGKIILLKPPAEMFFRLGTRKNYVAPSKSNCFGLVLLKKKNDYKKMQIFM